ncbi:MAG: hypothetical protein QGH24_04035 [Candidatus Marinimicrobia bacterium]|jgi:hypothetical protein|nr:hypothetical protein [Candidatus Neomarinimicrobiota bacterium]
MVKKNITYLFIFSLIVPFTGIPGQTDGEQSTSHYVWRSLMIPGWGEYSLNEPKRGKIFVVTETLLWIGMGGSFLGAELEENTYEAIAREHGEISPGEKPRQFWVDIGNYDSREDFITEHLRWRDFDAVSAYEDPQWDWNWDSDSQQEIFESKRVRSDKLLLMGKFFIGGIVLNHIISGIDALYLSRKHSGSEIHLSFRPVQISMDEIYFNLSISF